MDTIETNEPAGSDDVTSSPDTSAVDTQTSAPDTTVDDGSSGQAEETASETLLAGKYKTSEELVDAYKNLESKLGDLGQKASVVDLMQEKYGISPEQLKYQIQQLEQQQRQERYANNPLAPLQDQVSSLQAKIEAQENEKALAATQSGLESFLKENPAYEGNKDQLFKLAITPGIGFDPNTGLDTGFAELASEYFGQARAQGQQDAYKKIETKQNTQATPVSSVSKKQFGPEDLGRLSVAELEQLLPHKQAE